MKTRQILLLLLIIASQARADTISINLGTQPRITRGENDTFFSWSAFPLAGEQVSETFVFDTNVRLLPETEGFFIVVRFDNGPTVIGGGAPPWDGPATMTLLDAQGNAITPAFGAASTLTGSNGYMFAALVNPKIDQRPFDFYGVRYDFTAPDLPDQTVTRAFFRFGTNTFRDGFYGIGLVPETGSTVSLLALSLAALGLRRIGR